MNDQRLVRLVLLPDGRYAQVRVEQIDQHPPPAYYPAPGYPATQYPMQVPPHFPEQPNAPSRRTNRRMTRRREERRTGHPIRNVFGLFAAGFIVAGMGSPAFGISLWGFAVVYLISCFLKERGE